MSYFKNSKNYNSYIGHLGKDVETKALEDGSKVSKFSIATTRVHKAQDGQKHEKTIWVPCEVWGDHPALPFLKKGKQVSVDAYYDTSKSGEGDNTKYYHVFRITDIVLLGGTNQSVQPEARDNVEAPEAKPETKAATKNKAKK